MYFGSTTSTASARGHGGYHHFDMNDAFSVFEHFFGSRDPWEQFEDMVNGNLQRTMSFGRSGSAMGMSAFNDPFFSQAFGGRSSSRRTNFANFGSSVSSDSFARSTTWNAGGNMSSGMSQSTSTTTRSVNGQQSPDTQL
mmetsp:Transcript_17631/g.17456  ORF Transcript_17631/g.17456 Transcript_17631/m.17456 type:complete len:139 (+) Transcript_17631:2-418(+)